MGCIYLYFTDEVHPGGRYFCHQKLLKTKEYSSEQTQTHLKQLRVRMQVVGLQRHGYWSKYRLLKGNAVQFSHFADLETEVQMKLCAL